MTDQSSDNTFNRPIAWRMAVMGGAYGNVPALQAYIDDASFGVNCGVVGKPDHDGDKAVHYAILEVAAYGAMTLSIRSVRYNQADWCRQLRDEGVPEIFISPLETGVWTTGLSSLPEKERRVHFGERCRALTIRPRRKVAAGL